MIAHVRFLSKIVSQAINFDLANDSDYSVLGTNSVARVDEKENIVRTHVDSAVDGIIRVLD